MCPFFEFFCNVYQESKVKASVVEIALFYSSLVCMVVFCLLIWMEEGFQWEYLVTFIPVLFWIFMRSSRKDMNATGNLIAGIFGALGGAGIVIVSYMLKTQ